MRGSPADGMERTQPYLYRTRHHGSSRLHEYTGVLMQIGESELTFMLLDSGVIHRVEKACIDSYVLLADDQADDQATA